MTRCLRAGSVFSGVGGFDLGLERAGFEVVFQVEDDPTCNRVLARHWPDVRRYGDVRDIHGRDLPPVDLLAGGFPCQDLSISGRRAGLGGEQSSLWFEFHRIISEVRPPWILIENVPGLLSSHGGRDFATVLSGLEELGYGWAYRVLDAQYFGLAQRRKRVFIVGHLGGEWSALGEVLFEPESLRGNPAPSSAEGAEVAATLGGGSGSRGWASDTERMTFIAHCLTGGHQRHDPNEQTYLIQDGAALREKRQNGMGIRVEGPMFTLDSNGAHAVAFDTTQITSRGSYSNSQPGDPCQPLTASWHAPAIAIGGGSYPTFDAEVAPPLVSLRDNPTAVAYCKATRSQDELAYDGLTVRRLTPLECARLQGFPDEWLDLCPPLSDSACYRVFGNAVAVPVAEWIGRRIKGRYAQ